MVFCGQCGYQLGPGDTTCPRCGAQTEADLSNAQHDTYHPTEISHAILERPPTQGAPSPASASQFRQPAAPQAPLILGPLATNEQLANETTSQMYAPPGAYPQQVGSGMYGYPAGYQPYPAAAGQEASVLQLLESSRRGKISSLLLILFGLVLLIGAMLIFLLTQQGIIFSG
ncbi:MAG TPA: zinc ribbon domain-containing protein [Ktedonobacteraceae bacterium]|jgi:hypothetical protein